MPGKDAECRAEFDQFYAAHDGVPGFEEVGTAGIEQDAEGAVESMSCEHIP